MPYDVIEITVKSEYPELRDQVASFSLQLHSDGHPGETIPLGSASSVHCSVCYQFHFVVATNDGWLEDTDRHGEPLDGEQAALALLAHHSNQAALMASVYA
jgi:hypothetical protein